MLSFSWGSRQHFTHLKKSQYYFNEALVGGRSGMRGWLQGKQTTVSSIPSHFVDVWACFTHFSGECSDHWMEWYLCLNSADFSSTQYQILNWRLKIRHILQQNWKAAWLMISPWCDPKKYMVVWGCLSFARFLKKYIFTILLRKRSHSRSFQWSVFNKYLLTSPCLYYARFLKEEKIMVVC